MLLRVARVAALRCQEAKVIMCGCQIRMEFDRLLQGATFGRNIANSIECDRQFEGGLRIVGRGSERLAIKSSRPLAVSFVHCFVTLCNVIGCDRIIVLFKESLLVEVDLSFGLLMLA